MSRLRCLTPRLARVRRIVGPRIRDEEQGFTHGPQRSREMSSADLEERFRVSQDRAQIELRGGKKKKKIATAHTRGVRDVCVCVCMCVRACVCELRAYFEILSCLGSCFAKFVSSRLSDFERKWEKQRSVFAHDSRVARLFVRINSVLSAASTALFLSFFFSRELSTKSSLKVLAARFLKF